MDGAAGILVIILAVTLAIFLVLAIVLIVLLIRITKQIKNITDSAERTVSNVESATFNVSRFTTPASAFALVKSIINAKRKKEKRHVKRK